MTKTLQYFGKIAYYRISDALLAHLRKTYFYPLSLHDGKSIKDATAKAK